MRSCLHEPPGAASKLLAASAHSVALRRAEASARPAVCSFVSSEHGSLHQLKDSQTSEGRPAMIHDLCSLFHKAKFSCMKELRQRSELRLDFCSFFLCAPLARYVLDFSSPADQGNTCLLCSSSACWVIAHSCRSYDCGSCVAASLPF